jgi:hypothetical protein
MYQHLPLQDPPKFTQIGIFGLKIYIPYGNPEPRTGFDLATQKFRHLPLDHAARVEVFFSSLKATTQRRYIYPGGIRSRDP